MPWAGQGRIFCMGYPAKGGGGGKEINRPLRIFPFFPLLGEKQQKKTCSSSTVFSGLA